VEAGSGQRLLLALPIFLFLAPLFLNASGVRFTPPVSAFSVSAFQRFAYCWAFRPRISGPGCLPHQSIRLDFCFLLSAFSFFPPRALGLLLAGGKCVQAPEEMGPKSRPGRSHL
jgi:hypothetical protein